MSDELEKAEGEIVYLDPMQIEIDEYNVRHDSPIDEDVIEMIKDVLRNGREIYLRYLWLHLMIKR